MGGTTRRVRLAKSVFILLRQTAMPAEGNIPFGLQFPGSTLKTAAPRLPQTKLDGESGSVVVVHAIVVKPGGTA
jgi:hypothetical protein